MKNDSPNKFLGGLTAGIVSGGGSGGGLLARLAQAQSAQQNSMVGNAGSLIGGGAGTASAAPVAPDQANPFEGKTFQITPANMIGNAKPVFNESTSDAAAMMYGSPLDRQMSMPKAGTSAISMEGPLESNAFIGAKIAAEKAGESTFEVDGKTFNVK